MKLLSIYPFIVEMNVKLWGELLRDRKNFYFSICRILFWYKKCLKKYPSDNFPDKINESLHYDLSIGYFSGYFEYPEKYLTDTHSEILSIQRSIRKVIHRIPSKLLRVSEKVSGGYFFVYFWCRWKYPIRGEITGI